MTYLCLVLYLYILRNMYLYRVESSRKLQCFPGFKSSSMWRKFPASESRRRRRADHVPSPIEGFAPQKIHNLIFRTSENFSAPYPTRHSPSYISQTSIIRLHHGFHRPFLRRWPPWWALYSSNILSELDWPCSCAVANNFLADKSYI